MILDAPPSCIEFSPSATDYFMVGTYTLESQDHEKLARDGDDQAVINEGQSRSGSLALFKIEKNEM